ncbi:hypothetical protein Bhyg_07372, partial [Pseudolycoriella hygida]
MEIMQSRLSQKQKLMLQSFMNNNPKLKEGIFTREFTHQSAQKLWSKIARKLNEVPGAHKTWQQWKRTWKDIVRNSKDAQFQSFFDCHDIRDDSSCEDTFNSDNPESRNQCNEPATTNGGGTGASQMTGPSTSTMSDRMEELKMGSLATGGTTSGKTTIEDRADENSRDRKIRTASSAPSKSRSSTPAATKGGNSGASSKTGPMKPTGNS